MYVLVEWLSTENTPLNMQQRDCPPLQKTGAPSSWLPYMSPHQEPRGDFPRDHFALGSSWEELLACSLSYREILVLQRFSLRCIRIPPRSHPRYFPYVGEIRSNSGVPARAFRSIN